MDARFFTEGFSPGERIDLILEVRAPTIEGDYILELDLVQEGVAWFKDHGSKTACVKATIVASESSTLPQRTTSGATKPGLEAALLKDEQHFAMNCVPRAEVLDLLDSLGCKLEFIESSGLGGKGSLSYIYYARKRT